MSYRQATSYKFYNFLLILLF
jgi:laminin, gamma 1